MLTIPQRLPIKQMAVYGSTAMLVGFTSTLVMLRQFVPKDSPTGVSVVETINKKPASAVTASVETKQSSDKSTASVTTLPNQGELVVRNGNLPTQQYSRVSTATPTYTAPVSSTTPANASPAVTVGGTMPQQETTNQPSGSQPASNDPTMQSGLQETISNTNIIDINTVRLP
jgi:hypothetical protein